MLLGNMLGRYARTVLSLKPRQLLWKAAHPPSATLPPANLGKVTAQAVTYRWPGHGRLEDGGFLFLNRKRSLKRGPGWLLTDPDPLWLYHLHSFRWLRKAGREATHLLKAWLEDNPPGTPVSWDPYPLSLRVREWIEWIKRNKDAPQDLKTAMTTSLKLQISWLERRLEYAPGANHLLENLISLCWAGFSMQGGEELILRWWPLLSSELDRQIAPSGMHYERTPAYHNLMLEALEGLRALAHRAHLPAAGRIAGKLKEVTTRMLKAARALSRPDGAPALFGDTSLDTSPWFGETGSGYPSKSHVSMLDDVGFGRLSCGRWLLIASWGGPGAPDQPGHGHCDMLSFELFLDGEPIITDTGCWGYHDPQKRAADRQTGAHNTIAVEGRDQHELWSKFRCGGRGHGQLMRVCNESPRRCLFSACAHAWGGWYHRRVMELGHSGLRVTDLVSNQEEGEAEAKLRLHLHPCIEAKRQAGRVVLSRGRKHIATVWTDGAEWDLAESPYHPEAGKEESRSCLEAYIRVGTGTVKVSWGIAATRG